VDSMFAAASFFVHGTAQAMLAIKNHFLIIALCGGFALGFSPAQASADFQQITLGHYVFYVPKALMRPFGGYAVVDLQNKRIDHSQEMPIKATQLIISGPGIAALGLEGDAKMRPKSPETHIVWGTKYQVPYQIRLYFGSGGNGFFQDENRKRVAMALGLSPDTNGFVRLANYLVYKGSSYETPAGDTLVVDLSPSSGPSPIPELGWVNTALQKDLHLGYIFQSRYGSSVGLWEMHQEVVSSIETMMQPRE
jgi:hypothetical protein